MARFFYGFLLFIALALVLLVQGTLGGIHCEGLDRSTCAFAISSTGTRCVLEKRVWRGGLDHFSCRSSEIEAGNLKDWIETDECLGACGVTRNMVGISSDSLLEPRFMQKLCSPRCYQECPNIVDLYFNLAAGEGVFLPKLCGDEQERSARQGSVAAIRSSSVAAAGPVSGSMDKPASAPSQSEQVFASGPALSPL